MRPVPETPGQGLDNRCPWAETRRSVTVCAGAGADVPSFPSSDYWVPLPASGSGPPVLQRRWTPAASGSSPPPPDYWTPIRLNDSAAPLLERHWAGGTPLSPEATSLYGSAHDEQTATAARPSVTAIADSITAAEGSPTLRVGTVSTKASPPSPQTVTRLCEGCGQPLVGKRPQAKTHGTACRQRAYRQRRQATESAAARQPSVPAADPQLAGPARTSAD